MVVPNGRHRGVRRLVLGGLVLCGAGVIAAVSPAGRGPAADSSPLSEPLYLRDCPHSWPNGLIGIAPTTTNIPEYHDCQRFIMPDGNYGPLVAVFAWDKLESLERRVEEQRTTAEKAVAAAEILNASSITYKNLGIAPGHSCLYMYKDKAESDTMKWKAKLVSRSWSPPANCQNPINPYTVAGRPLEVRLPATTSSDFNSDDIVPAARWEWDPTRHAYYVGIKCESKRWCEVGVPDFKSSPAHPSQPSWSKDARRSREIKGWYDEQQLAVPSSPGSKTLAPSVIGTVFPAAGLKTRSLAYYKDQWREVAYVSLSAPNPHYRDKFNFVRPATPLAPVPVPKGMPKQPDSSTVSMCRGRCDGIPKGLACTVHSGDSVRWFARIQAPGRSPIYKCVWYWPNPVDAPAPPGSVRWRFIANDETIWVTCPSGCCQIEIT